MDRGGRSWVTIFSQRIDPMLLQENKIKIQTPFSNNNKKKRKTYRPVASQKQHTLRKQVAVEYLKVWFR